MRKSSWYIFKGKAKKVVRIVKKNGAPGGYALVIGGKKGWLLLKANGRAFAKRTNWIKKV